MRLVLDNRARAWLRRLPRITVYSAAELLLLAVLAVQVARLVWVAVTPVGPLGDWRPAEPGYPGSASAMLGGFDPFFRLSAPADGGAAVVTSLQLTLYGTRIDEAMGGGSAIIAGADGVQQSIGVGQEIAPGVRLKSVAFDHVTIDRGGAEETLFLSQGGDPAASTAAATPAPAGAGTSLLGTAPPASPAGGGSPAAAGLNLSRLRSEIGFIPRIDGGRVSGLVVRPQGSGAAFRQIGLQEGDVVTAIAGRPVRGAGDLEALGAQFGNGGQVPITVERGRQTLALVITVAGQ